ncbi:hypothetical protein GCM10027052_14600 [Parafrigoribacterium mesophilum]
MQPLEPNDRHGSSRHRVTNRLARPDRRLSVLAVLGVLASVGLVGVFDPTVGTAVAEDAPIAPVAFGITEPHDGAFLGSNAPFEIRGTKPAGSGVTVSGATTCAVAANDQTVWQCTAPGLPNGAGANIVATQITDQPLNAPAGTDDSASGPQAPSSSPRPTAVVEVAITVDVLGAPALNGPAALLTSGIVSGTAMPGAGVVTSVSGSSDPGCVSKALDSGYWSCSLAVPSGTYHVSARQSKIGIGQPGDLSEPSGAKTVTVDKVAPPAPVVTAPRARTRVAKQPARYAGTGETHGWVDVYVDGRIVCSASVVAGSWSCSAAGIRSGTHYVQAIQRDLAGNYSPPSQKLRVFYGPRAAAVPPVVVPPAPSHSASPFPTPPVTPAPVPITPLPTLPDPGTPPAAGSNWGAPTSFGVSLSTPAELLGGSNWPLVPLAVALFIALIAVPLRLLATASRGRIPLRPQLFGRNRPALTEVRGRWSPSLSGALSVAAAAGLVVLATGVGADVRYLRLTAAVVLALSVLNLVGVAVATRATSRLQRLTGQVRFLPLLLMVAALVAVVSRMAGFEPPLVAGVVIGMTFGSPLAARARAMVNLAELATIAALSVTAWVAHGALGTVTGFWGSFASEALAALCLSGAGSLVVLSLPIGRFPGRAILEWSTPAWIATIAGSTALASGVALGDGLANFPAMSWLLAAAAFAAMSVATWAWFRFVEVSE